MTEINQRSYGSNDDNVRKIQISTSNNYINNDGRDYSMGRNPLLNRINGHSNSGSSSSAGGRDINYCEIYFLSPSKRRKSGDNLHQQISIPLTNPITNDHINWSSAIPTTTPTTTIISRDRINSHSQTDEIPSDNSNNIFVFGTRPTTAYDANLDNLEIRSHYSDSAATITKTSIPIAQQQIGISRSRNNNVTFSNCTEERVHSNRGSLRRTKGRSSQSLCSCDADTEIIPNPNRPLYQYNLVDRKNKIHTYTCEQNAQILMRLEREKRKLSRINVDKQGNETNEMLNGSCEEPIFDVPTIYHTNSNSIESESTTDVDIIPPPPRLLSKSKKSTSEIFQQQQQQQQNQQQHQYQHQRNKEQQQQHQKQKQQQYHQQQDSMNDYNSSITTSSIRDTESMLNDCTSTILNCANVGHLSSNNNSSGGGGGGCGGGGITTKPDLCNINKVEKMHRNGDLNSKIRSNQENIPMVSYPYIRDDSFMPCFKTKNDDSFYFYHEESPQYAPNFDNRPNSGKYNTIGPSSCYAKHLAPYYQTNICNLSHLSDTTAAPTTTTTNLNHSAAAGRYFSQSLTNFSATNNSGNGNNVGNINMSTRQYGRNGPDGYQFWHNRSHDFNTTNTTTPYTQFRTSTNGLNCNFGESALIDSSYTSIGSSSSGLKTKLHRQQQQQQQQQHLSTPTAASSMPWKHRQCPSRGSSSSGTNSLRFDPSRHWLAVSSILLIVGAASVAVPMALRVAASAPFEERLRAATQLLDEVPLIDGHNDLPWNIRKFLHNKLNDFNFDEDLRNVMPWARSHWSHTDLQRLKKGRVSAQFWAAYVPCEAQHRDAVQLTLEQIDVIKRLTERYSPQLTTCTSASDIVEAHKNHQLCSLTGVEGGHSLGGSLAVLRTLYAIGVRYMTLTSTCHTPWADSSYADAPTYNVKHGGLTVFGKTIIREMNRLGMIVDLSHVSTGTMRDALATSEAPVIFSHSSAYELCNSSRNVQDDILQSIAKNGGIVMVNFYSKFLSCSDNSTVHDAVAHINHIKRIAGIDHVGLGAGFDGINFTPKGLEDVSTYPTLFAELLGEGWSIEDLTKLAGQNFLRVMTEVEKVRDAKKLAGVRPYEDHPNFRTEDPYNCTSS